MPKATRPISESSSSASASPSFSLIGTSPTKGSSKPLNLALVLVLIIIAYALRACPLEAFSGHPVCRGVGLYKDEVVEPYILPTIRQVQANDAAIFFVAKTKGAGEALHNMLLYPAYDKVVVSFVPLYKRNYPRFRRVRNHLNASAGPYVLQADAYREVAVAHFRRLESAVRPFIAHRVLPLLREGYSFMVGMVGLFEANEEVVAWVMKKCFGGRR